MRPSSNWGQNTPKANTSRHLPQRGGTPQPSGSRHLLQRGNPQERSGSSAAQVPLSVYRELAAELQAKEALLNSLNTQNQQLAAQNQQLRQEIAIAVQSVLHLSQFADATKAVNSTTSTFPHIAQEPPPQLAPRPTYRRVAGKLPLAVKKNSSASGKLLIEQQPSQYRRYPQSEIREVKGWWLVLTIVLIMLTAFSAGFLIVRPLVQRR